MLAYTTSKFSWDDAVGIVEGAERSSHADQRLEEWRAGGAVGEMDFQRGARRSVEATVEVVRHLLASIPAAERHSAVCDPAFPSMCQCAHEDHPSAPEALFGCG